MSDLQNLFQQAPLVEQWSSILLNGITMLAILVGGGWAFFKTKHYLTNYELDQKERLRQRLQWLHDRYLSRPASEQRRVVCRAWTGQSLVDVDRADPTIRDSTSQVCSDFELLGKLYAHGVFEHTELDLFFYTVIGDTYDACLPYIQYCRQFKPQYGSKFSDLVAKFPARSVS